MTLERFSKCLFFIAVLGIFFYHSNASAQTTMTHYGCANATNTQAQQNVITACKAGSPDRSCVLGGPGSCSPGLIPVAFFSKTQCTAAGTHSVDAAGYCVPNEPPPPPCPEHMTRNAAGNCQCIKMHPDTLACVSNCAALKGGTFGTTNGGMTGGSRQGCAVSCSSSIGGPWPAQCVYLGTDAEGEGNGSGTGGEEGGNPEGGGESGSTPEGAEEAPEDDEEGNPQPCPPGTIQGEVNGKRYCAPDDYPDPEPLNPTEADPTGLGPRVEQLRQQMQKGVEVSAATGNAINRQTAMLEHGLSRIEAAITAQDSGSGSGGDGQGDSAGDCDPTAADYWDCLAGDPTALEHTEPGADSAQEIFEGFAARVANSDIGRAGSRLSGSMNVGNCPTAQFQMFNQTYIIDFHCTIFEEVRPVLEALMTVVWVAFGIIILLSA